MFTIFYPDSYRGQGAGIISDKKYGPIGDKAYGETEVGALAKQFGKAHDGDQPFLASTKDIYSEWLCVKKALFNYINTFGVTDPTVVWAYVAEQVGSLTPQIMALVQIMFVLSVHTADVERGFSQFVLIKTDLRNSLSSKVMDALLRVKLHVSPEEIGNADSVVLAEAEKLWVDGGGAVRANVKNMLCPLAKKLHDAVDVYQAGAGFKPEELTLEGENESAQVFGMNPDAVDDAVDEYEPATELIDVLDESGAGEEGQTGSENESKIECEICEGARRTKAPEELQYAADMQTPSDDD